jgi:hypothetical protein
MTDRSEQLAHRHNLFGHGFGPSEGSGDGRGGFLVVGKGDFGLLGGGSGGGTGGLIVGAQPADQPALFFRRPFVVERDEAGEQLLFENFGIGTAAGEDVSKRGTGSLPVFCWGRHGRAARAPLEVTPPIRIRSRAASNSAFLNLTARPIL